MTVYKVALRSDVRQLSTHYYLSTARAAQRQAGSEYHIYGWDSGKSEWYKVE